MAAAALESSELAAPAMSAKPNMKKTMVATPFSGAEMANALANRGGAKKPEPTVASAKDELARDLAALDDNMAGSKSSLNEDALPKHLKKQPRKMGSDHALDTGASFESK